jgi:raffinose/stachyose/melibiose transport system substrate-binding protein
VSTATRRRVTRRLIPVAAAVTAAAFILSGCSSASTASTGATKFTYLHVTEDPTDPAIVKELAANECKAENKALPYQDQTIAQASLDQKVQLLAGQNGLPTMFAAAGTPAVTQSLDKSGQLLNIATQLKSLGVGQDMLPAAASTIKNLYGGNVNALPLSLNIEGFWYNKKIFADNHLTVPSTWSELLKDAAALKSAGVQPFATGAQGQGWPVTRLISGYLFREVGPNALAAVRDGKAKLTDPAYVMAAQAVQDLGTSGYLGSAPEAVDYNTIISDFLTGKAGIMYMGSWVLPNFADPKQDQIGSSNIGFFPYPSVPGGKGDTSQLPANIGVPTAISKKSYNPKVGAWLKCLAQNWGSEALAKGQLSGFKVNKAVKTDALTKLVQSKINSDKQSLVWFEAYFSAKASTTSWNNIAQMVDGKMTALQFMQLVQADL